MMRKVRIVVESEIEYDTDSYDSLMISCAKAGREAQSLLDKDKNRQFKVISVLEAFVR